MTEGGHDPGGKRAWDRWSEARALRWTLSAALVVGSGAVSILDESTICRQQLASVGEIPVVETCGPPSITDLPVIAVVLLLAILLAPDLSEISIGVLSLKQRVSKAERVQQHLTEEVEAIRNVVTFSASTEARQNIETSIAPVIEVEAPDLPGILREVAQSLGRVPEDPTLKGAEDYVDKPDPGVASLLGELVLTLSQLEYLLGLRSIETPILPRVSLFGVDLDVTAMALRMAFPDLNAVVVRVDPQALESVREAFVAEYEKPLGNLRVVRAFAVHGLVSESVAKSALKTARTLFGALSIRIEGLPRVVDSSDTNTGGAS